MAAGKPTGPLVFAHRGSSAALPEHTLAAYVRALDEGSDGLECDVRLTRDGHLVCVHDRRLDRTSLATRAPGDPVTVTVMSFSALALARIRRLAPTLPTVYLMEVAAPGV